MSPGVNFGSGSKERFRYPSKAVKFLPKLLAALAPLGFICPVARNEAENAALAKVIELPLGEPFAKLLTQIKLAKVLFQEIAAFYRRVLEGEPGAVPGWMLEPGGAPLDDDPAKALAHFAEMLSVQEFLACCTVSVPELECAWSRKERDNGVSGEGVIQENPGQSARREM